MSAPCLAPILIAALLCAAPGTSAHAAPLRVSAASSLTEAFGEIAAVFERAHSGEKVELNFAGSQVLRAQIEQGAPVDVFASADLAQMEPLVTAKLVQPARVFAHNRLVAAASSKSGAVRSLADLAKPGIRVVVADPTVPAGRYTTQLLGKMAASGLFGADFPAAFEANVVSQETNVRVVLAKVSLGEADAGIVYRTDVGSAKQVTVLEIPEPMNVVATYPIAVVLGSASDDLATAFVELVLSEQGQAVLRKAGFEE
ncbi:MAG: molybdate ABC transporter substrate-binding protein [bacterium]